MLEDEEKISEEAAIEEAPQAAETETCATSEEPQAPAPDAMPQADVEPQDKGENKFKKIWARVSDSFIVSVLLGLILIRGGFLVGSFIYLAVGEAVKVESSVWEALSLYLPFTGVWIVVLLYMLITKKNRPIFKALGPGPRGNNLKALGIGLLVGFVMNLFCAVVAMATGDISLSFNKFDPSGLLIVFIFVFVQSSAEELVCRVFIYQRMVKRYKNVWFAAILNSVIFGALHLRNPGITWMAIVVIILCGLLFSAMVICMDSSWAPMGAHAAWNFTQNILLGLPNSGHASSFSWFKTDAVSDSWSYDVAFGLEGTITAVAVMTLAIVILVIWGMKHKKQPYSVWGEAAASRN